MRRFDPDMVITHSPVDYMLDHEGASRLVRRAAFALAMPNYEMMLSRHVSQREWLRSHHGIDQYLDRMTAWPAGYGSECGFAYAEGFRQHLGHGYPHEPLLQNALAQSVHVRDGWA
jgi:hypothetical protein